MPNTNLRKHHAPLTESTSQRTHTWKEILLLISLYSLLTILLTYPLIFNITTHVPSDDRQDTQYRAEPYQVLWYYAHFKNAVLDLKNPFLTNAFFYPAGENMVFNIIGYYPMLLALFFQLFTSLIFTYNMLILLSFVLSALSMYALIYALTKNKLAAFASGIFYSFSAYHYARAFNAHPELQTIEFLPLFLLFLIKWHQERKTKYALLTGFFLFLNSLASWYYGLYALLILLLSLLFYARKNLFTKTYITHFAIILSFFTILILPFVFPLLHEMATADDPYWSGNSIAYHNASADPLSFIIPSWQQTFFTKTLEKVYKEKIILENLTENTTFLGYITLILATIGFLRKRKEKNVRFFILLAFFSFILSLGPTLHILKRFYPIPLPYHFLTFIPFLNALAEPARFAIITQLSIVVIAAYGITYFTRLLHPKTKVIFITLLILLALIETLPAPIRLIQPTTPFFYTTLANNPQQYALLELPLISLSHYPAFSYYQIFHGKQLINGLGGRISEETKMAALGNPLVHALQDTLSKTTLSTQDILLQNISDVGLSALHYYNIQWIALHKNWFGYYDQKEGRWLNDETTYAQRRRDIETLLYTSNPTYEDSELIAYAVPPGTITTPFMTIGTGWYDRELWHNNTPSRWVRKEAQLHIISPSSMARNLTFTVGPFGDPKTLTLLLNNQPILTKTVTTWTTITTPPLPLINGENTINLKVLEDCQAPQQLTKSTDTRCLALTIENVYIN